MIAAVWGFCDALPTGIQEEINSMKGGWDELLFVSLVYKFAWIMDEVVQLSTTGSMPHTFLKTVIYEQLIPGVPVSSMDISCSIMHLLCISILLPLKCQQIHNQYSYPKALQRWILGSQFGCQKGCSAAWLLLILTP